MDSVAFELFVSSVSQEGPFLRVWGQRDRNGTEEVERTINQFHAEFEKGTGVPDPTVLFVDMLCCARYNLDKTYYRAKIEGIDWASRTVQCIFIDYGNRDRVAFADLRLVEHSTLFRLPAQASSYILAGAVGAWNEHSLKQVMEQIGYMELKCFLIKTICQGSVKVDVIKIYFEDRDLSEILQCAGIATHVPQDNFEVMIWQAYAVPGPMPNVAAANFAGVPNPLMSMMWPSWQRMAAPVPAPAHAPAHVPAHVPAMAPTMVPTIAPSMPPVPILTHIPATTPGPMDMSKSSCKSVPQSCDAVSRFSTIVLQDNSEHRVYISHCDKGTFNFAVQLSEFEKDLEKLSTALNNPATQLIHLKQPYIPGTNCLSRFHEDDNIYRAVITSVEIDKCHVYFVDFGNSDKVACKDLFEIPPEFTHPKVMALQFSLAGMTNVSCTDDMRAMFYDAVIEKEAVLKVVPPKCGELAAKQLCHLFIDDTNVTELINTQILKKQPKSPMFHNVHLPAAGSKVKVVVAYVKNFDSFYVQLASQQNDLEAMMSSVSQFCNGPAVKMSQSDVQPGASCCALFSGDGQWYRAFIVNANVDDLKVMYVDYGNEEKVSLADLRIATEEVVAPLRAQAIPCRLSGFDGKSTDETLVARFEDLCLEKTYTMHVVQFIEHVPCIVVKLLDENGTDISSYLQTSSVTPASIPVQSEPSVPLHHPPVVNHSASRDTSADTRASWKDSNETIRALPKERGGNQDVHNYRSASRDTSADTRASWKDSNETIRALLKERGGNQDVHNYRSASRDTSADTRASWKDSTETIRTLPKEKGGNLDGASTIPSIPPVEISIGCKKLVNIVFSNNPHDFYVHERPENAEFENLMDQIALHYNSGGDLLHSPTVGAICVAKFSEDDTYYRGIVREIGSGKALVLFLDYGNSEMVEFNDIKKIKPEFLTTKAQAIHCLLKGVPPNESDERVAEFNALSECESLEAEFAGVNDLGIYSILLRDTCKASTVNEVFGATPSSLAASSLGLSVPHPPIADGSDHDVLVSSFETPGRFYLQLKSTQDLFRKTMTDLQKDYRNKTPLNGVPVIGQTVVAKYSDGAFYRAIIKVQKGNKYGVQYLDYGNKKLVDQTDIFALEEKYTTLPMQAVLCSLKGVEPMGTQWTKGPEVQKFFNGSFHATFTSGNAEVPFAVSLKTSDHTVVADLLVDSKQAKLDKVQIKKEYRETVKEVPVDQHVDEQTVYQEPVKPVGPIKAIEPIEPIDEALLVGQSLPALCVLANNKMMYISFNAETLSKIKREVEECRAEDLHLLQSFSRGTLCLALNKQFRRAIIENCGASGRVVVKYLDHGGVEEVSRDNLYSMPDKFSHIPSLVFECVGSDQQENQNHLAQQTVTLAIDKFTAGRFYGHVVEVPRPLPSPVFQRRTKVTIAHAENSTVWLHKISDAAVIASLLDAMFESHENGESLSYPTPSTFCAAKSELDGNWYRAELKSLDESGMAIVHFTDYGNNEQIPVQNLKKLNQDFINIPALAVRASLPIIAKEDLGQIILDLAEEKILTGVFSRKDGQWLVELLEDEFDFSLHLISTGKAIAMENSPCQTLSKNDNISGNGTTVTSDFLHSTACTDISVDNELEVKKLTKFQGSLPDVVKECAEATVVFFNSPDDFFMHLGKDADVIDQVASHLLSAEEFEVLLEPSYGCVCAAQFLEDGLWYRAKIIGGSSPSWEVHFIDFGNEAETSSIRRLPSNLLEIPALCIQCALPKPAGSPEWSKSALMKCEELIDAAVKFNVEFLSSEEPCMVHLNCEGMNLNHELAAMSGINVSAMDDLLASLKKSMRANGNIIRKALTTHGSLTPVSSDCLEVIPEADEALDCHSTLSSSDTNCKQAEFSASTNTKCLDSSGKVENESANLDGTEGPTSILQNCSTSEVDGNQLTGDRSVVLDDLSTLVENGLTNIYTPEDFKLSMLDCPTTVECVNGNQLAEKESKVPHDYTTIVENVSADIDKCEGPELIILDCSTTVETESDNGNCEGPDLTILECLTSVDGNKLAGEESVVSDDRTTIEENVLANIDKCEGPELKILDGSTTVNCKQIAGRESIVSNHNTTAAEDVGANVDISKGENLSMLDCSALVEDQPADNDKFYAEETIVLSPTTTTEDVLEEDQSVDYDKLYAEETIVFSPTTTATEDESIDGNEINGEDVNVSGPGTIFENVSATINITAEESVVSNDHTTTAENVGANVDKSKGENLSMLDCSALVEDQPADNDKFYAEETIVLSPTTTTEDESIDANKINGEDINASGSGTIVENVSATINKCEEPELIMLDCSITVEDESVDISQPTAEEIVVSDDRTAIVKNVSEYMDTSEEVDLFTLDCLTTVKDETVDVNQLYGEDINVCDPTLTVKNVTADNGKCEGPGLLILDCLTTVETELDDGNKLSGEGNVVSFDHTEMATNESTNLSKGEVLDLTLFDCSTTVDGNQLSGEKSVVSVDHTTADNVSAYIDTSEGEDLSLLELSDLVEDISFDRGKLCSEETIVCNPTIIAENVPVNMDKSEGKDLPILDLSALVEHKSFDCGEPCAEETIVSNPTTIVEIVSENMDKCEGPELIILDCSTTFEDQSLDGNQLSGEESKVPCEPSAIVVNIGENSDECEGPELIILDCSTTGDDESVDDYQLIGEESAVFDDRTILVEDVSTNIDKSEGEDLSMLDCLSLVEGKSVDCDQLCVEDTIVSNTITVVENVSANIDKCSEPELIILDCSPTIEHVPVEASQLTGAMSVVCGSTAVERMSTIIDKSVGKELRLDCVTSLENVSINYDDPIGKETIVSDCTPIVEDVVSSSD